MNATVLVGVEVTTPQTVREEFDVDEEDFVDVNIMNNATVDEQPDSTPLIVDDAGDYGVAGGDDRDNDNAASGMVEMASSHRPAEDPSYPNITQVRSRRNKPGGSGGYSDDSGASGGGGATPPPPPPPPAAPPRRHRRECASRGKNPGTAEAAITSASTTATRRKMRSRLIPSPHPPRG